MSIINPAKYVRVNHDCPSNNIWFYEMTDGKWTIQYGSMRNTVMASKIVESAEADLVLIPFTFHPQTDGIWFDLNDDHSIGRAMLMVGDEPAGLALVRLWSGINKKYRVLDFSNLSKCAVIQRIQKFYKHKTYRKALETYGSCFYGFMSHTVKLDDYCIMLGN